MEPSPLSDSDSKHVGRAETSNQDLQLPTDPLARSQLQPQEPSAAKIDASADDDDGDDNDDDAMCAYV